LEANLTPNHVVGLPPALPAGQPTQTL